MPHPQDDNQESTAEDDLRFEILRLNDALVGAAATTELTRADASLAWSTVADRDRELIAVRATAAAELSAMRAAYEQSRRFRVGSAIVAPLDAIRQRTTGRDTSS